MSSRISTKFLAGVPTLYFYLAVPRIKRRATASIAISRDRPWLEVKVDIIVFNSAFYIFCLAELLKATCKSSNLLPASVHLSISVLVCSKNGGGASKWDITKVPKLLIRRIQSLFQSAGPWKGEIVIGLNLSVPGLETKIRLLEPHLFL